MDWVIAFPNFIIPFSQMGATKSGKANATEVWDPPYCVRCLEHKRGKHNHPTFNFALVLLLTCIKFCLMQDNQKQHRWPAIQNFAPVCQGQASKFLAFRSLLSLFLCIKFILCKQDSQERGRKKEEKRTILHHYARKPQTTDAFRITSDQMCSDLARAVRLRSRK